MERSEGFDSQTVGDIQLVFEKLARGSFNLGKLEQRRRRQHVFHVVTRDRYRS